MQVKMETIRGNAIYLFYIEILMHLESFLIQIKSILKIPYLLAESFRLILPKKCIPISKNFFQWLILKWLMIVDIGSITKNLKFLLIFAPIFFWNYNNNLLDKNDWEYAWMNRSIPFSLPSNPTRMKFLISVYSTLQWPKLSKPRMRYSSPEQLNN